MTYLDAYGLGIDSDLVLPGGRSSPPPERLPLSLRRATAAELAPLLEQPRYLRNLQAYDGAGYVMLGGVQGDTLFAYGREALLHLSADAMRLRYAVTDGEDPAWQRVLLDTVLWTVSLSRGFELLHGSAVMTDHGLLVLVARTGGGKSTLAAEWMARGATLFADDVVALSGMGNRILAHPGPALMNLPETISPARVDAERVLADFGDERWVALRRPELPATPVSAVVLINRSPGESSRCEQITATSLTLLGHALSLPHLQDRARHRFDIFSTLVAHTAVYTLHADPAVAPADLADLIERQLATP